MSEPAAEFRTLYAGLRPGRSFYSWQLALADEPQIIALHAWYADLLRELPDFTAVPLERMAVDVQGIGFDDRVPEQDLTSIVEATRRRLTNLGAIPVTVGPAVLSRASIQLPIRPVAPLQHVRELTQAAITDVWGDDSIPNHPDLDPHLVLAKSNKMPSATWPGHSTPSTALSITTLALCTVTRIDNQAHRTTRLTLSF